jgi:hypothetical protein
MLSILLKRKRGTYRSQIMLYLSGRRESRRIKRYFGWIRGSIIQNIINKWY